MYLLSSAPHAEALTPEQAILIVRKAHKHGVDPFDLWTVYDSGLCDDLDHAVTKVLEMHAFYATDDENEPSSYD